MDRDPFIDIDFLIEPGQIPLLLIGSADLPDILQGFLNAVGDADSGRFRPFGSTRGDLPGAEQQAKCHWHSPQAGDGQTPVIHQQAHRNDRRGDVRAIQIPQHMRPDMFHAVHVAHQRLRQVGQIALAKVSQRQLAQPLRQTEAGGLHLVINQAVGVMVLL